jgi:hypothetical protein
VERTSIFKHFHFEMVLLKGEQFQAKLMNDPVASSVRETSDAMAGHNYRYRAGGKRIGHGSRRSVIRQRVSIRFCQLESAKAAALVFS